MSYESTSAAADIAYVIMQVLSVTSKLFYAAACPR